MKLLATALLALCLSGIAIAQVYKTTDENGRTVYTDRPSDGAENVEIRETNSSPPINMRPTSKTPDVQNPSMDYRVRITSPANETHLTPGERDLTINFTVNQPLKNGVRAQLLSNGSPVGRSSTDTSITLFEVERGEHNISVIIYDQDDRILAESAPVTIYSHRTTAPKPALMPTPKTSSGN